MEYVYSFFHLLIILIAFPKTIPAAIKARRLKMDPCSKGAACLLIFNVIMEMELYNRIKLPTDNFSEWIQKHSS